VLVNDRLVVLRLRKCATAYIVTAIRAVVGGEFRKSLEIGRDVPTSHGRIDFPLDGRRVVGTVRNPWSWYTSLWAYGCEGRGGLHARVSATRSARSTIGAMAREVRSERRFPHDAVARFRAAPPASAGWPELYADADDVDAFREWLRRVLDPQHAPLVEPWYGETALPPSIGLLTWRYLALFSRDADVLVGTPSFDSLAALVAFDEEQNVCDEILRTDRIGTELPGVLARAGYELDPTQQATLTERTSGTERRNASQHRQWREYYDAASTALVARRDALVVERFGFEPPDVR
jgi:hypothetical protein